MPSRTQLGYVRLMRSLFEYLRDNATLRRASAYPGADPRVRQNLALVVGLQGRFTEAEGIARADLPSDEGAANVAYLRQLLEQQGELKTHSAGSARRT